MGEYRVIRTPYVVGDIVEPCYSIHRCLYEKGKVLPVKFGLQPAAPEGDDLELLRADLMAMLAALDKPVLTEKGGKLKEWVPK